MNILQVIVVVEVPLLCAQYCTSTTVSVCQARVRPSGCAPICENCKAKCQVVPPSGDECQRKKNHVRKEGEKIKKLQSAYLEWLRFRFRTRHGIKCYWLRHAAVDFLSEWRRWRERRRSWGGVPRITFLGRGGRVTAATIDNGGGRCKWERWPRRRRRCARYDKIPKRWGDNPRASRRRGLRNLNLGRRSREHRPRGGAKTWLRMEGKERSGDILAGCRGFGVRGVRLVIRWKWSAGGWSTEENFADRGRDNVYVRVICIQRG